MTLHEVLELALDFDVLGIELDGLSVEDAVRLLSSPEFSSVTERLWHQRPHLELKPMLDDRQWDS